jgi:hypothetical protein
LLPVQSWGAVFDLLGGLAQAFAAAGLGGHAMHLLARGGSRSLHLSTIQGEW